MTKGPYIPKHLKTALAQAIAAKDRRLEDVIIGHILKRELRHAAEVRVVCGAKTRNGTPCKCKSEPGKKRCRFHGGKSTGPRTPEGKARIAEAQRKRWAEYRHRKFVAKPSEATDNPQRTSPMIGHNSDAEAFLNAGKTTKTPCASDLFGVITQGKVDPRKMRQLLRQL